MITEAIFNLEELECPHYATNPHSCPELNQLVSYKLCKSFSKTLSPFYRLNKEYKKYAQMLQHTGEGVKSNGDEAHANKLGILCSSLLIYIPSSDNGLSRGDT